MKLNLRILWRTFRTQNKSIFGSTHQRNTVNFRRYQALYALRKSIKSIDSLFAVGIFLLFKLIFKMDILWTRIHSDSL